MIDEHENLIQHSNFVIKINCNAENGKRARQKFKEDLMNDNEKSEVISNIISRLHSKFVWQKAIG